MKRLITVIVVGLGALLIAGCASTSSSASSAAGSQSSSAPSSASSSASAPSAASGVAGVLPEVEWGDLFATVGDDAIAFGQRVQSELPVKAYALWQGEGGGEPIWYEDPADIRALFNALAASGIAGEAQTITTDDYTSFGFEFADGTKFSVMFDSMSLQVQEGNAWKFYQVAPSAELSSYADQAKRHTMESYERG